MQKQPEIGELYTRKNGKVYEVQEAVNSCDRDGDNPCAFLDKKHCVKVTCLYPSIIIYVRRKDLEVSK